MLNEKGLSNYADIPASSERLILSSELSAVKPTIFGLTNISLSEIAT